MRKKRMVYGYCALIFVLLFQATALAAGPLREMLKERGAERQAEALPAGTQEITITVGGGTRSFLLHLPPRQIKRMPVVFSFHGYNEPAVHLEKMSGFSRLADERGFAAVYPQGVGNKWHVFGASDEDVVYVRAVADYLLQHYPGMDKSRFYADGISNGAQMAYQLACAAPDVFAAFGFVSGNYPQDCKPSIKRPIVMFHGSADKLLPYEGRAGLMGPRALAVAWVAVAGCKVNTQGTIIYQKGDATGEEWSCAGPVVDLDTLKGKGHSWPGSNMPTAITSRDVDASAVMWDFFNRFLIHIK